MTAFKKNRKFSVVKRLAIILSSVLAVLVMLPIVAIFVWWFWAHFVQSPLFARTYFEGLIEFDDVVESRRWHWGHHPWAGLTFGCSYAVVNIPKASPSSIPKNWKGQWVETPVTVPDGRHDILGECTYLWPGDLSSRLNRAHNNPGSYYTATSETLLLYSPIEGVAAYIRFGD